MATSLSTCGLPSNTWFVEPIWAHNPNGILIGSAVFAQMTVECPYTLQWDAPFPPKIIPSPGGSGPSSNTWFPGLTWVLTPNSTSIGASVFAGLTGVTDWQTDHATRLVTIGHIYVCSSEMQPNNNNLSTGYVWWLDKWLSLWLLLYVYC